MNSRKAFLLPGIALAFALAVHCSVALRFPNSPKTPPPILSVHAILAQPTENELAWLRSQANRGVKVRLIHDSTALDSHGIEGISATRSPYSDAWTEGVLVNAVCFIPRANIPLPQPNP
jgi:hypothetical protein